MATKKKSAAKEKLPRFIDVTVTYNGGSERFDVPRVRRSTTLHLTNLSSRIQSFEQRLRRAEDISSDNIGKLNLAEQFRRQLEEKLKVAEVAIESLKYAASEDAEAVEDAHDDLELLRTAVAKVLAWETGVGWTKDDRFTQVFDALKTAYDATDLRGQERTCENVPVADQGGGGADPAKPAQPGGGAPPGSAAG